MSSRLDFRVAKLERAPGADGVDLRVYGTAAEAAADTRPARAGDGDRVTGVPRSRAIARRWSKAGRRRDEGNCATAGPT